MEKVTYVTSSLDAIASAIAWSLVIGQWSLVIGQWSLVMEFIYKITIDNLKNF
ncbi:MAG: hypothetical protein ACK4WN_00050 [Aphanizomenon sp.]|jgi:hypothetical protein|nr:hypothetical protein [Aphanizomenon flos-aquae CP01]